MLVFATYHAIKKVKENNLSPAEFLRPFGEVGDCNGISMRTCDKNEFFKLNDKFRINFIDVAELKPSTDKERNAVIKEIVTENTPDVPVSFENIERSD